MITLTQELIEQLRTPAGGFNQGTMEILGCWPLTSGWKDRLVGTRLSEKNWRKAMKAKKCRLHHYRGNTRRAQP